VVKKHIPSLARRLQKAGIRHYEVLIHDQSKEWLIKNFSQGATVYPVNVTRLMRNIVWQTRERIVSGEKRPLTETLIKFVRILVQEREFALCVQAL